MCSATSATPGETKLHPSTPAAQIAAVREQTKDRKMPWTADTLMQVDVRGGEAIKTDADGVLMLPASAAKTYGQKLAYRPSLNVLAPWRIETDVAEWTIQIPADGEYQVSITLAADEASAGDAYVIEAETATAKGIVKSTGGYETFAEQLAGIIKLKIQACKSCSCDPWSFEAGAGGCSDGEAFEALNVRG